VALVVLAVPLAAAAFQVLALCLDLALDYLAVAPLVEASLALAAALHH
jgi:hypothetical protein